MPQHLPLLIALVLATGPALAEKADRNKPLVLTSERQGRVIDHDSTGSMEKKKQEGYF